MVTNDFEYYENQFKDLRERLIRVLGAPTVNRLVERAVTEITRAHPTMAALRSEDDRLVFDEVKRDMAGASPEVIRDAFMALAGVLLLLVARLLGREIATRLTEGVTLADILEAEVSGGR
jgi:hypothetical protein